MPATEPATGIVVHRARDYFAVARSMRVIIDGQEVGAVRYGGRAEFPLLPGIYSVRVAMDWCRSETYEVHVWPGEVAEVEGGLRWRGLAWRWSLVAVFVAPGWVFVVRPCSEQRSDAGWRSVWEGLGVAAGIGLTLYLLLRVVGG